MCEFNEMTNADKNEYNRREREEEKSYYDVCIECGNLTDNPDDEFCSECRAAQTETESKKEDFEECCPECGELASVFLHTLYCLEGCRKKFNSKTFEAVQ